MRNAFVALWGLLVLLIIVQPAAAQQGNLAQIIEERPDLSTLATFINAANPSVRQTLASDVPLTFFAPDNQAFNNLASFLGAPLQELLQNPEIVTQILQYHIVDGAIRSRDMIALDGQVIPTRLSGAFVGIRISDDETITINNVVEITETDVNGRNGVLHILNDVLLNRIIAKALDNERTPTPDRGVTTEVLTTTPEATLVQPIIDEAFASNVRIGHFSPDARPIDIYVDDVLINEGIAFDSLTDFVTLAPGTHTLTITSTGESLADAITEPLPITLNENEFVTIAVLGSIENETFDVVTITEDFNPTAAGKARLVFYHALEGIEAVDILIDEMPLVTDLSFGATMTIDVDAGVYDPLVTAAGAPDTVLFDVNRMSVQDGSYLFFAVLGTQEAITVVSKSVLAETADELRSRMEPSPITVIEAEDASEKAILDILAESGEFTILLSVLEAARPRVLDRLTDEENPVTLIAPNDAAFRDLLATAQSTQLQLVANTNLITDILLYHIVDGVLSSEELRSANGTSIMTNLRENQAFFVTVTSSDVVLNNTVRFERFDILASNGVIHVVEDVLLPQSALKDLGL